MITRVPHKINGRFYGMFCHWDDGRCIYFACRSGSKTRSYHFDTNSWCLDIDTLRAAESRGCQWIGIEHKIGTNKFDYYITRIEDFFGADSERHYGGDTPQRRLKRPLFRILVSKYGAKGHLLPSIHAKMPIK